MIEFSFMRRWAGIVESAALFAMTVLSFGVMVRIVNSSDVLKYLGAILCVTILLLELPAIMASAWSSMTIWQHLGIVILGIAVGLSLRALRQVRSRR
jgi:hypothetical protein